MTKTTGPVRKEYYFRTGQFIRQGNKYKRHCGPTAVTNLLFTLSGREGRPLEVPPERVFGKVARIGKKRAAYINANVLGRFGGTSDFLAPSYIRASLRSYGIRGYKVFGLYPAVPGLMKRHLDRGAVLYLEVHLHPKYGNHHMLCYGYRVERDPAGGEKTYFRLADGWGSGPTEVEAGTLGLAMYSAVIPNKKQNN